MNEDKDKKVEVKPTTPKELTPEEVEKILAENEILQSNKEELNQVKEKLVNEVKELRSKKQVAEQLAEELKQAKEKKEPSTETPEVLDEVKKILEQNKQQAVKKQQEKAMNEFLSNHPEFSEANDVAGIRLSALQSKLERFSLSGMEDKDDFLAAFEDANALLGNVEKTKEDTNEVVTTPVGSKTPKSGDSTNLSAAEQKFVNEKFGGNVERYKELKEKYPETAPTFE